MTAQLVDYSFSHPAPSVIKAAGYVGVMRYISPGSNTKNLSPAERDGLHAAGLSIGLVWESSAGRAGQGLAAGIADSRAAEAAAGVLGYPSGCPIFYAVDSGALSPAVVQPYFQGLVRTASRYPVGVYGSASVVDAMPTLYKWQTAAWSGGVRSAQAHLYQLTSPSKIAGTDVNNLLNPFPMWGGTTTVSSPISGAPASIKAPAQLAPLVPLTPTVQEDDMRVLSQKDRGIWFVGPNYAHVFTPEEWSILSRRKDLTIWEFGPDAVGLREFDVTKAAFTQPTA
jgi:hypothetical protein